MSKSGDWSAILRRVFVYLTVALFISNLILLIYVSKMQTSLCVVDYAFNLK